MADAGNSPPPPSGYQASPGEKRRDDTATNSGEKTRSPEILGIRALTPADKAATRALVPRPDQARFMRPGKEILTGLESQPQMHPVLAIVPGDLGDEVVGVACHGRYIGVPGYWITALLVDAHHQERGYAAQFVAEVLELVWHAVPSARAVFVHHDPRNAAAGQLYRASGFTAVPDASTEDNMVLQHPLAPPTARPYLPIRIKTPSNESDHVGVARVRTAPGSPRLGRLLRDVGPVTPATLIEAEAFAEAAGAARAFKFRISHKVPPDQAWTAAKAAFAPTLGLPVLRAIFSGRC